jgi:hypothetical protein
LISNSSISKYYHGKIGLSISGDLALRLVVHLAKPAASITLDIGKGNPG